MPPSFEEYIVLACQPPSYGVKTERIPDELFVKISAAEIHSEILKEIHHILGYGVARRADANTFGQLIASIHQSIKTFPKLQLQSHFEVGA